MENPIKKLGLNEMLEGSKRLNNYLSSIDTDLKALQRAFNQNVVAIIDNQKELKNDILALDTKLNEILSQLSK